MGYYIMGRYTSEAWFATKEEAEAYVAKKIRNGQWSHTKPYIMEDTRTDGGKLNA